MAKKFEELTRTEQLRKIGNLAEALARLEWCLERVEVTRAWSLIVHSGDEWTLGFHGTSSDGKLMLKALRTIRGLRTKELVSMVAQYSQKAGAEGG